MSEILLVGNPNSGKTTLFNSLTRSNEHVGNWHGVTVENKQKSFMLYGQKYDLVDTPGIYSLEPLSFEEEVAVKTILKHNGSIINLCDQNNLQRNLYLTLCLIERGCNVVVCINEIDKKPIFKIDVKKLSDCLGVPVVQVNAEKKVGIDTLKNCLVQNAAKSDVKSKLPYMHKLALLPEDDFKGKAQLRYKFIEQIIKDLSVSDDNINSYIDPSQLQIVCYFLY